MGSSAKFYKIAKNWHFSPIDSKQKKKKKISEKIKH